MRENILKLPPLYFAGCGECSECCDGKFFLAPLILTLPDKFFLPIIFKYRLIFAGERSVYEFNIAPFTRLEGLEPPTPGFGDRSSPN